MAGMARPISLEPGQSRRDTPPPVWIRGMPRNLTVP